MNWDTLLLFISATAALAISPGPDNIYVLVQSLTNSKSHALATVAGLMIGCIIHTTLLAFGVSVIIRDNNNIFLGIKILGAIYLLYLAYKVFKSDSNIYIDTDNTPKKSFETVICSRFFYECP